MSLEITLDHTDYVMGDDYVRYGTGDYERHLLKALNVERGYYGTKEFTWGQLNAAYFYIKKRKKDCSHYEFEFIKSCLQRTKCDRSSLTITFS